MVVGVVAQPQHVVVHAGLLHAAQEVEQHGGVAAALRVEDELGLGASLAAGLGGLGEQ